MSSYSSVPINEAEIPIDYVTDNLLLSAYNPSYYHVHNTYIQQFFRRYLLENVLSVYKVSAPPNWDVNYFLRVLFVTGFCGIIDTPQYGIVPQWGTISGRDLYYRPTTFRCVNPYIERLQPEYSIGGDCALIRLTGRYCGIMDLINFYADQMALIAENVGINMFTVRSGYVAITGSKAGAEALKKAYDYASEGNPFVVLDKELLREDGKIPWEYFAKDLKNNYLVTDLLADLQKIRNMFYTDIGITNANTDKRERLISDEVNANNASTYAKCDLWLDNIRTGLEEAKRLFPALDVTIERRYPDETKRAAVGASSVPS